MSKQARNQLGTPGVAKSFLRGPQIFQTISTSFQLCPTYFSRGGGAKRFAWGGFAPFLPGYGPVSNSFKVCLTHFSRGTETFSSQLRLGFAPKFSVDRLATVEAVEMNFHLLLLTDNVANKCNSVWIRGGTGFGVQESTPAGFCVFFSDPDPKSKICEKPDPDPESLFHFGSSRSLCGHFCSKIMGKLQLDWWLQPESEQGTDSQIEKISGLGFKNFGTGAELGSGKVTPVTSGVMFEKKTQLECLYKI